MDYDHDGPPGGHSDDDLPDTPVIANIEAEAALLGAMLHDNSTFDTAIEFVTGSDFYEPIHATIFGHIQDAIALGRRASAVSLMPLLVDEPQISELGGPSYVKQLVAAGAGVGAKDFAVQIADLSKLRRLHDQSTDVLDEIRRMKHGVNPAKYAAQLESLAFDVTASKNDRTNIFTVADSIRRVTARVRKIQAEGAPTGAVAPDIEELELAIGPLERTHLHIWAGRPGMGKSALMCGAARSMASQGYGIGVISLEMGDIDLGQRFAADVALSLGEKILHASIRDAKLGERELEILDWCAEQVDKLPLKLVDMAGITLARVAMIARRMKREFEAEGKTLDVLFVDYLQLIVPDGKQDGRVNEVSAISMGLKRLAKELDIAVVALSQLSRAVEQREVKIPQLADLRDSGSIEQDADTVLFLYREYYYLKNAEPDHIQKPQAWEAWKQSLESCRYSLDLICAKRRGGETNRKVCTFLPAHSAVRSRDYFNDNIGGMFS